MLFSQLMLHGGALKTLVTFLDFKQIAVAQRRTSSLQSLQSACNSLPCTPAFGPDLFLYLLS